MVYGTSSSEDRRFGEFIGEMISLPDVINHIAYHFRPEQIFEDSQLEDWARENDFVHIDDKP